MEELKKKIAEAESDIGKILNPILGISEARNIEIEVSEDWKEKKDESGEFEPDVQARIVLTI